MKNYKIIVSTKAEERLKQIVEYIRKDAPAAADKVKKEIITTIKGLKTMPKKYSKEEFLPDSSDYRSVSRWHFKIVYKVMESQVTVLTIFHTNRHPEQLEKEI